MVRIFLAPQFSKEPNLRFISSRGVDLVQDVAEADFVLVPQFVRKLEGDTNAYLNRVREFCAAHHKLAIACKGGDLSYAFNLPGFTVFTSSLFHSRNKGEVAVPAPIEDLTKTVPFMARHKGVKPLISFCGYAGFPSFASRCKYWLKNAVLDAMALVMQSPLWQAYKRGIYFRLKAMQYLKNDTRVTTHFIVRNAFSGKSGAQGSEGVRQEYLESIVNSDFVLCPKGDANYSERFYETLALGRIPVLIDTDMVLPLEREGIVDYSRFIVRVPYTELEKTGEYIMKFWNKHNDVSFAAAQQKARETFRKYLQYDEFYNTILPLLKERV
jgi:hypothetical protein